MYEIKKVVQPVKVEAVDLENGLLRVTNWRYFTDLCDLAISYEVTMDGVEVRKGDLPRLRIQPGESMIIDAAVGTMEKGVGEYWLTIYFESDTTPWCRDGHLVAWEQFRLNPDEMKGIGEATSTSPLETTEKKFKVEAEDTVVTVDSVTGNMTLAFEGKELITHGPTVNLWRAPIDNDIPNMVPMWKEHKLDQLETKILGVQAEPTEGGVQIIVQGYMQAEEGAAKNEFTLDYLVKGDGSVRVTSSLSPAPEYTWLPRNGVNLKLPQSMKRVQWFGKGPYENYSDRNEGTMVGLYEKSVDGLFEPYIVPQENGNRSETRWLEVSDGTRGLKIIGDQLFEFSAHRYDIKDLEEADHLHQLDKKPYVNLYLDQMQAGLGSAGCGPDTLFKYRVKSEPYTWSFTIKPIIPF